MTSADTRPLAARSARAIVCTSTFVAPPCAVLLKSATRLSSRVTMPAKSLPDPIGQFTALA